MKKDTTLRIRFEPFDVAIILKSPLISQEGISYITVPDKYYGQGGYTIDSPTDLANLIIFSGDDFSVITNEGELYEYCHRITA